MNGKSFVSLLFGLAAGAALGILYAPDKGSNTREKVRRAASGNLDDLKDDVDGLKDEVEDKASQAKEDIKDIRETIKKKTGEFKEGAREYLLRKLDRLEAALRKAEDKDAPAESPEEQPQQEA